MTQVVILSPTAAPDAIIAMPEKHPSQSMAPAFAVKEIPVLPASGLSAVPMTRRGRRDARPRSGNPNPAPRRAGTTRARLTKSLVMHQTQNVRWTKRMKNSQPSLRPGTCPPGSPQQPTRSAASGVPIAGARRNETLAQNAGIAFLAVAAVDSRTAAQSARQGNPTKTPYTLARWCRRPARPGKAPPRPHTPSHGGASDQPGQCTHHRRRQSPHVPWHGGASDRVGDRQPVHRGSTPRPDARAKCPSRVAPDQNCGQSHSGPPDRADRNRRQNPIHPGTAAPPTSRAAAAIAGIDQHPIRRGAGAETVAPPTAPASPAAPRAKLRRPGPTQPAASSQPGPQPDPPPPRDLMLSSRARRGLVSRTGKQTGGQRPIQQAEVP
jgi:hypothetical protein